MRGLVVDLFAGGGGASLGMSQALGREPDIAINHDPVAIAMHQANHPNTVHYCQSVWAVEPIHVTGGRPVDILWASPDCKHFSKAKGGKPKCQNIRDLAWVVIKWAKQVRPTLIMLENVEEFTEWGPLGPDKRPIESMKGTTFRAWRRQLQNLGYRVQHRELRACDYGAPTIRKRMFLIARRDDLPIVWPEPIHGPGRAHPYRTAAECIDWSIPCPSIFERARPLAENTLKRIARGIDRFVIHSPRPFIVGVGDREGQSPPTGEDRPMRTMTAKADKALAVPFVSTYYGPKSETEVRGQHAAAPLATVTTENRHAVVAPAIVPIEHYNGRVCAQPVDAPMRTITASTKGGQYAVMAPVLVSPAHSKSTGRSQHVWSPGEPLRTVTASQDFAVACPVLMTNTTGHGPSSLDGPVPALTTGNQQYLTLPVLVGAGGPAYGGKPRPVDQPMGTLLAENHQAVAACVLKHYGGVTGHRPDTPLGTVTGVDHHSVCTAHILRQFGHSVGAPADAPVGTVMPGGGGKTGVVTSHLVKLYGSCRHGTAVTDPMPTATAGGNHLGEVRCGLVDKYYGMGGPRPMNEPMGTATTKDRFGLADVRFQAVRDHAAAVRDLLIRFRPRPVGFVLDDWDGLCGDAWAGEVVLDGVVCRIVDVGLRMFEPRELFRAQSFPDTYEIAPLVNGKPLAKKYQTKACGNSVPPVMSEALTRANWVEETDAVRHVPPPLLVAMEQAGGKAG